MSIPHPVEQHLEGLGCGDRVASTSNRTPVLQTRMQNKQQQLYKSMSLIEQQLRHWLRSDSASPKPR